MQETYSLANYTPNISGTKEYIKDIIGKIYFLWMFLFIFFQLFTYHLGIFRVFSYFPAISFVLIIFLQALGYIKFTYNKHIFFAYFLFICWIGYGAFSLIYHPFIDEGTRDLKFRMMNFFTFYVITQFIDTRTHKSFYELVIVISVIFLICVNVWEITTLQHLQSSRKYNVLTYVPTGACYNENNLAAYYLVCSSILLNIQKGLLKTISSILLILVFVIILIQGARLIMIALFPFLLYHLVFKTTKIFKLLSILIISLSIYYLLTSVPFLQKMAKEHLSAEVFSFGSEVQSQRSGSMKARLTLYRIGLEKLVRTRGLGVGIGNFERTNDPQSLYKAQSVPNAHSLFFEIIGNEGIVGITVLMLLIFTPLLPAIINKKHQSISSALNIFRYSADEKTLLVFYIFFIVAVSIPSSIYAHCFYYNILGYFYALMFKRSMNEVIN
jgi:hypothetical protein